MHWGGQGSQLRPVETNIQEEGMSRSYLDSFLIEAVSAALPAEWDVECNFASKSQQGCWLPLHPTSEGCNGIIIIIIINTSDQSTPVCVVVHYVNGEE